METNRKAGMTLCIDEIASDERLCWIPATDDIAGLCEHASQLSSTKFGKSLDTVRAVAEAVRSGRIHVGQEIMVAAFARNDENDYGAKPVLILPTCKRGSYEDAALIWEKLRQAWRLSPYGEVKHGKIWSLASDGDPKRRPALYLHCMVHEIRPEDGLFQQDLDWKHCFKRLCKLLCTREGILLNGTYINKTLLSSWLGRLMDVDWSDGSLYSLLNPLSSSSQEISALLDPKDPQDVPRAIKLLTLIPTLRKLDRVDMNPSELQTHSTLSLLGEMLEALVKPFIEPAQSLSQQITSLAKFAFILCALFIQHGSAFMPFHLYSDLQCMIRTAVFRVAHTKLLDEDRNVYLCLLGDDVLEVLFGRIRMIGGHSPNVAADEFCNRAAGAVRLDLIFQDYPKWERSARRLMLKRGRDADHLSPRHWKGELSARSCNLLRCWDTGISEATAALAKYGHSTTNFDTIFSN
ncbi:hypothetical protein H1R20_g4818, partial [Candolleomyces eurysporus]